jgi:uncharacterized SAM-binding protein YcdF (DUF218 family)
MLTKILELCLLPPLSCLLIATAGLVFRNRWPRAALVCAIVGIGSLWLFCTPVVAGVMLRSLQVDRALMPNEMLPPADAIVVLSAEMDLEAAELGGPTVGAMTLQRVRYGAYLQRTSGLPLLVTGGPARPGSESIGSAMARVLAHEFSVDVRWVETASRTTWENAALSASLLSADGISRVLLVTHAWHMPRARSCFEKNGIRVIAAPTSFRGPAWVDGWSVVPHPAALRDSAHAMHEWLGLVFYAIVH